MFTLEERTCPSALDLLEYVRGGVPRPETDRIRIHILHCMACRRVLENLQRLERKDVQNTNEFTEAPAIPVPQELPKLFSQRSKSFERWLASSNPETIRFGQFWTTRLWESGKTAIGGFEDYALPRIVVILSDELESEDIDEPSVTVVPISLDTEFQSDFDLLVPEEECPLGYECMIEVWNEISMLKDQLDQYLGALRQPFKRYLGGLYQAQLGIDVDLSESASYLGPTILHESDPRTRFRELEIEACDYLRQPLLSKLRDETEESDGSADPDWKVVALFPSCPVQRKSSRRAGHWQDEMVSLAAASVHGEWETYVAQCAEGLILRFRRNLQQDSLYALWERVAEEYLGKRARITLQVKNGRTISVDQPLVFEQARTLLSLGSEVAPGRLQSISIEFMEQQRVSR